MKMNKKEIKELEEKEQLERFIATDIGAKWVEELGIINYKKSESPDFIMETKKGEAIALEITKFIAENENLMFSQALTTMGNKICREAEQKHNIHIHMVINKYDQRKYSIDWNDHVDLAKNPGFSIVPDTKLFRHKLQKILENSIKNLKKGMPVQDQIQIEEEYFKISIVPFKSPWTGKNDCHVNNAGKVVDNPTTELQECIDNKNEKIKLYSKNCAKCYLLIVVPNKYKANYCSFNEQLSEYKFDSKFDNIFLYDESSAKTFLLN